MTPEESKSNWLMAAVDATTQIKSLELQIRADQVRVRRLKVALKHFKKMAETGEPWPSKPVQKEAV